MIEKREETSAKEMGLCLKESLESILWSILIDAYNVLQSVLFRYGDVIWKQYTKVIWLQDFMGNVRSYIEPTEL